MLTKGNVSPADLNERTQEEKNVCYCFTLTKGSKQDCEKSLALNDGRDDDPREQCTIESSTDGTDESTSIARRSAC